MRTLKLCNRGRSFGRDLKIKEDVCAGPEELSVNRAVNSGAELLTRSCYDAFAMAARLASTRFSIACKRSRACSLLVATFSDL